VTAGPPQGARATVLGVGGLGRQLITGLAADEWGLLAVDLRTGLSTDLPPRVRTALADIRDADELTGLFQSFRPDVVVNTAAVSADTARRQPNLAVDVNVLGAASVARAAVRSGAALLVLISCASVYGRGLADGPGEATQPAPTDLHSGSNAAAESISAAVARQGGIDHLVVRLPALYGDRERTPGTLGWALWRAARDAVTNRVAGVPVPDTDAVELLHVTDAADALARLVRAVGRSPGAPPAPQVLNVGADRIWTADQLIQAARAAFPETHWVRQAWEGPGVRRPLDTSALRALVDFAPAVDLPAALRRLAQDRSEPDAPSP